MDFYFILKTLHILSSTILFGTGLGIAFVNFWGQRQSGLEARLFAAKLTVLMDLLFTTPAVIVQPVTGFYLLQYTGYEISEDWVVASMVLYGLAGLCWLPVVWIQIKIKQILSHAVQQGKIISELPNEYHKLLCIWFALGWPAFISLVAVFYLMVSKEIPL